MPNSKQNHDDDQKPEDLGDKPVSINTLIKWGGLIVSLIMAVIGAVWQISDLRSDGKAKDVRMVELERRIIEVDKISLDRHGQQQRDIDKNSIKIDSTDKLVVEVRQQTAVISSKMDALVDGVKLLQLKLEKLDARAVAEGK